MSEPATFTGANGEPRVKDREIVVPVVFGTVAWWLGKKHLIDIGNAHEAQVLLISQATDDQSHRWTVYLRGANGQDLSACIKQVVFKLHPSFANPVRPTPQQPFELTEVGWGEFEIVAQLVFHDDAGEKEVDLIHKLRLYAENETQPTTKRPVVSETYEEIVFSEPTEALWRRFTEQGSQSAPEPALSCLTHVSTFNPQDDLRRIHTSRQRIAAMKGPLHSPSGAVAV